MSESRYKLVSVPDPKPTPAQITFSITRVILEVIYEWGETRYKYNIKL